MKSSVKKNREKIKKEKKRNIVISLCKFICNVSFFFFLPPFRLNNSTRTVDFAKKKKEKKEKILITRIHVGETESRENEHLLNERLEIAVSILSHSVIDVVCIDCTTIRYIANSMTQ